VDCAVLSCDMVEEFEILGVEKSDEGENEDLVLSF
jgi:hypothetical protein